MPKKVLQKRNLARENANYRNSAVDRTENAKQRELMRIRKERAAHFKALEKIPFFKEILSKKIPIETRAIGKLRIHTLLGVGFEGEGNFRRTVLVIDAEGRTTFWGEQMRGVRTMWAPYRILKEDGIFNGQKQYKYNELETWSQKEDNEAMEINWGIKSNLDQIKFQKADLKKMMQIKRLM
jgi:hypothetical protein